MQDGKTYQEKTYFKNYCDNINLEKNRTQYEDFLGIKSLILL